jgi:DNA-binding XRE family transcriptional regulator
MNTKIVAQNIKLLRNVRGLSQGELADNIGIHRASLGSYEEGRAVPKNENAIAIAKYFGITAEQLISQELTVEDLNQMRKTNDLKDELIASLKREIALQTEVIKLLKTKDKKS